MMKRFLFFAAIMLPMLAMAQTKKKVAIYVTGPDAALTNVIGSKLVSAFARSREFTAVERTSAFLTQLKEEQKYQRSGAVDDSELSRLGKQFGVQYICVASVLGAFNEMYLSARLIDVESAQVERTASSSRTITSLPDVVEAANSISDDLLSSLSSSSRLFSFKKVAVYIAKNDDNSIGKVLGDKLVEGFTKSGRYVAIERTNSFLSQLNKEQKYQHTGEVDDSELSRLGIQFGVQYICVADYSEVYGEIFISARLIDVETAEVVNTCEVSGVINNMKTCVKKTNEIASELSKGTLAERAVENKGLKSVLKKFKIKK